MAKAITSQSAASAGPTSATSRRGSGDRDARGIGCRGHRLGGERRGEARRQPRRWLDRREALAHHARAAALAWPPAVRQIAHSSRCAATAQRASAASAPSRNSSSTLPGVVDGFMRSSRAISGQGCRESSSCSCSRLRARCSRDITVPSGIPMTSAISRYDSSSTSASSTTNRQSGGRAAKARSTASLGRHRRASLSALGVHTPRCRSKLKAKAHHRLIRSPACACAVDTRPETHGARW